MWGWSFILVFVGIHHHPNHHYLWKLFPSITQAILRKVVWISYIRMINWRCRHARGVCLQTKIIKDISKDLPKIGKTNHTSGKCPGITHYKTIIPKFQFVATQRFPSFFALPRKKHIWPEPCFPTTLANSCALSAWMVVGSSRCGKQVSWRNQLVVKNSWICFGWFFHGFYHSKSPFCTVGNGFIIQSLDLVPF